MSKFRTFLKLRNIISVGVSSTAAAFAGVFLHAHCSGSQNQRISPLNIFADSGNWYSNWDKRDPQSLVKRSRRNTDHKKITEDELAAKTTRAVRHVFLIRHGQYNLAGKSDIENYLTPLGNEQAGLTGKRLAELGIEFDSITSSDMTRAKQTTEEILNSLTQGGLQLCQPDPLLREGAPARPDPPLDDDDWNPNLRDYFTDGARIEAAFRKYIHRANYQQEKDSYEIIVCHANVIRYFFCRALQFPGEAWLRMNLNHASLTVLSIYPNGQVIARSLGDSGHLPVEKCTIQ